MPAAPPSDVHDSPEAELPPVVEAAAVMEDAPPLETPVTKGTDSGEPLTSRDDEVSIPDFRLLRRIGSGAYGEVWLAQAITGALRAVKIVWREDFEYEKTFRREFEGIQQFEPISRGHRGLVHVLHVGWNEVRGFYYYVMELGDDAEAGNQIDVDSYVPRTLSTDFKNHGRLDLAFCKEAGIFLADALGYMHSYGLTHRDIKPSNIIFVDGVCKLADIGLVAAHGERSFVGTEGFVPPEGPGTFSADIYSLGKVLYEISSGNDRMDFPAFPDDLAPGEIKLWREWNEVICRACSPDLKDRYASAADFAEALRMVGVPKPVPVGRRLWRSAWKLVLGSLVTGSLLAMVRREVDWSYAVEAPESRKLTPEEMAKAKLPAPGRMWLNSHDVKFTWKGDRHQAERPVGLEEFNRFLEDEMRSFEGAVELSDAKGPNPVYAVVVPREDADSFTRWLTAQERAGGGLDENHEYTWKPDPTVKRSRGTQGTWSSMRLEVVRLQFGRIVIESKPSGAEVLHDGQPLGTTPLVIPRIRVGQAEFVLSLPGYRREVLKAGIVQGRELRLAKDLKPTESVAFGRRWRNSLGIEFTPLGAVLIGVTEVRRADFAAHRRALPLAEPEPVDTGTDVSLPMTHVTRAEAELFCKWLTHIERAKGLLEENQGYRLPTDDEWSMAAGLPREKGDTPADRNQRIEGFYPWGYSWPPAAVQANLWDKAGAAPAKGKNAIEGYDDTFAGLAPAGSFPPNELGVRDLAGNVWEWVQEDFSGADPNLARSGVLRGGSWRTYAREELLSSHRRPAPASIRSDETGFRIVLGEDGMVAREED